MLSSFSEVIIRDGYDHGECVGTHSAGREPDMMHSIHPNPAGMGGIQLKGHRMVFIDLYNRIKRFLDKAQLTKGKDRWI